MSQVILDVDVRGWGNDHYRVSFRLSRPKAQTDEFYETDTQRIERINQQTLLRAQFNPVEYGQQLARAVFANDRAKKAWTDARAAAKDSEDGRLRFRLSLDGSMPHLHSLNWEALCDPITNEPLAVRDDCLFSRYLRGTSSKTFQSRGEGPLRALVAIASPRNLDKYKLSDVSLRAVNLDVERDFASGRLEHIEFHNLSNPVTVDSIMAALREPDAQYDVLYLVCHGAFVNTSLASATGDKSYQARIWLEDEYGDADVVSATSFSARLSEVDTLPRLAVLASCHSAGNGEVFDGALAAFGPQLVAAGIPAVVAMQGEASVDALNKFLPVFFDELRSEGQIDLAMGRARGVLKDLDTSWTPVLFLRLNAGRIWAAQPKEPDGGLVAWDAVISQINQGQCTPIIGGAATQHIFGCEHDLAKRWSIVHRYPLDPTDQSNLARISQYLAVTQAPMYPRNQLKEYLKGQLFSAYDVRANLQKSDDLETMIRKVGQWHRTNTTNEPHKILAHLRCPLYLTTNGDSLMHDALQEEFGTDPEVGIFDWRLSPSNLEIHDRNGSGYATTQEKPLVYHMFGHLSKPGSMVLTEDDYFAYLRRFVEQRNRIPSKIRERLTDSGLLFVGYQLSDWSFRALLQMIAGSEGRGLLGMYKHVAVQIDPAEDEVEDADMARRYLRAIGAFGDTRIEIYMGSVQQFMDDLTSKMAAV